MVFHFREYLDKGIAICRQHWMQFAIATFLYLLILVGIDYVSTLHFYLYILSSFLTLPLTMGLYIMISKAFKGETPNVGDLFEGFKFFVPLAILLILISLALLPPFVLGEYLGLAFIVAVLLHIFYNWKSMKNYFSKKSFIIIAVTTLLVSNVFILQSLNQKQSPKGKIIKSVLQAPLKDSYTILNIINAKEKLEKEGFEVVEASTLQELAKLNGKNPFEIISILTK